MSNQEPVSAAIQQFLAQITAPDNTLDTIPDTTPLTKEPHSKNTKVFIVALSGGADSMALLDALSKQVPISFIQAVYINHQLQSVSEAWADANSEFCRKLGVSFKRIDVEVNKTAASLENEARKQRYRALSELVGTEQYLLTGHHQDDQAETLLLQLFRGAGPKGLSAMPIITNFSGGQHARPLLSVSKQGILNYCEHHDLSYVEDPSNLDTKHRRNFIRHEVLPLLESEWPKIKTTLSRASQLQSDTQELLTELAAQDFAECYVSEQGIRLEELGKLSSARQKNVVRYWLQTLGLGMPSAKVLDEIISQQLESSLDSQPRLDFDGGIIRRNNGFLTFGYGDVELSFAEQRWDGTSDLKLTETVTLNSDWLKQNHADLVGQSLTVSLRQGGERFKKPNAQQSTSLKNYFQEVKVPAWQRDKVILIKLEGVVRAIYQAHLEKAF